MPGFFRRSRLRTNENGATIIEFAVLAGVLAVMVLGIIDFGRAFWFHMEVQNAAQAGADWAQYNAFNCGASPSPCTSGVPAGLRNAVIYATNLSLGSPDVTVAASGYNGVTCGCPGTSGVSLGQTCGAPCTDGTNVYGGATGYATVTVNYNFRPIFPWPALSDPQTLSGNATAVCKGGTTC